DLAGFVAQLIPAEVLVVEGDGEDRPAGDQFDGLDLPVERVQRVAGEAIILPAGRGVLHDHPVGAGGGQDLEAARVGRVHQAALALDHDDVGPLFVPGTPDGVLDLSGHEVVDQRVEDQAVAYPLHPG